MTVTSEHKGHPTSISHLLTQINEGQFHDEASEALRSLVADLSSHEETTRQKCSGILTIKLKVKLEKGVFELAPDLKVEKPKPIRGRDIYWCDENHNLTPENPRQHKLALRDVTPTSAARAV